MYAVAVKRDFIAQHFLVGGDWGAENHLHSHHYHVEVQLVGPTLDQHGYLVDIVDIESALDSLTAGFRDRCLNDLAEFAEINPSIEHFSRIFCEAMKSRIDTRRLSELIVTIWENDIAWARYTAAMPK